MARRICPKAKKAIFPDKLECDLAIAGIHSVNSHHRHRKFREEPARSIYCKDCGGWHMTSRPDRKLLTR